MLQPWPQDPFQGGADLCEQAVESVGDPGRFVGQVVVEAHAHLQLGDRLVLAADYPQRVGHRGSLSSPRTSSNLSQASIRSFGKSRPVDGTSVPTPVGTAGPRGDLDEPPPLESSAETMGPGHANICACKVRIELEAR